jgi:hypothetical protein
MGGNDITTTAYNHATKTISIARVTGNVSIKAVGRPYDAEVEWLESSGTQYIQLSLAVSKTKAFAVGGEIVPIYSTTNRFAVLGASPDNQFKMAFYSYNSTTSIITYSTTVGNNATNGGITLQANEKSTFELSTSGKTINGVYTEISRPLTQDITAFRIFGGYANNYRYPIRIYSFYIKVDDNKIYDLIPVRDNGVGYLYDKVSGQLFGNANSSGEFTYGNDV